MISLFKTDFSDEEISAVSKVMKSGKLVLGENVEALERDLAAFLGVDDVVTCGSGTDALTLIMEDMLEPGWQVIVPALTFSATYEAVVRAKCDPVICDVDPQTLMLSVEQIKKVLTPETMAIIVVHLYGWPCPEIQAIRELCDDEGLILIEDCAQAFGADIDGKKVGTFGDAAAFSFYPTKPLGGIGDGGAIVCGNPDRMRARRNHGRCSDGQAFPGCNSRLDEINASVLRMRLATYYGRLAYQRGLVERYSKRHLHFLEGVPAPHVFPILLDDRDEMRDRMASHGIETRVHYDPPVSGLPYVKAKCPNAERASKRVLSLPCHWGMTFSHVDLICRVLAGRETKSVTGRGEREGHSPRGSQTHRAA